MNANNQRAKRPTPTDLDHTPHWALNLEAEWPHGTEPWAQRPTTKRAKTDTKKKGRA